MNAPAPSRSEPRIEDYPFRLPDNVRYADLDPNNHVNNAVYSSYFETCRVLLTRDQTLGLTPAGFGWVLAGINIHFRAELHWPGQIELGLAVARLGRTSVTFDQVVFSQGRCIASAAATTVMVDLASRKPVPLPDQVRTGMERWKLKGAALG